MKFKRKLVIATTLIISLFSVGCDNKTPEGETQPIEAVETKEQTVSLSTVVKIPKDSQNSEEQNNRRIVNKALGTTEDVTSVKVKIKKSGESVIFKEFDLTETPAGSGNWTGTVLELPINQDLDFVATAYNSVQQAIFDSQPQPLTKRFTKEGDNSLVFLMQSIDDGQTPDNPMIVSAQIPPEMEINSKENQISFQLEHSGDLLSYVSVQNGSVTSPVAATWNTHNPATDLVVTYDAPATKGTDLITLKVKDPKASDTVGISIPLNIVETLVDSGATAYFGPAITNLEIIRGPTQLSLDVEVSSNSTLTYSWSGTGDFADATGDTAIQVISPFTDNDSGTITVTVTDEQGIQTTMSRTINAGDYPYNLAGNNPCILGSSKLGSCVVD